MSVRILQTYVSLQPRSLALFEMFQPRVENLLDSMHLRSPHRFRVVETLIDRIKTLLDIVKPHVDVRMRTIKSSVHIRPQSVHVRAHVAEPAIQITEAAIVDQNSDQYCNRRHADRKRELHRGIHRLSPMIPKWPETNISLKACVTSKPRPLPKLIHPPADLLRHPDHIGPGARESFAGPFFGGIDAHLRSVIH